MNSENTSSCRRHRKKQKKNPVCPCRMLPYKIQSHRAADTKRSSGCSVNEQQPPKTLCSSLGFAHFVSLKVRPEKHLSNDINKLKKKN